MADDIARVKAAIAEGAARGLRLAAEHLLTESRRTVPIEEATLERSGRVSVDEAALQGATSYDTPYAVRQHEDMTLRHDAGRTAKFLENAVNSERDNILLILLREVRRGLDG